MGPFPVPSGPISFTLISTRVKGISLDLLSQLRVYCHLVFKLVVHKHKSLMSTVSEVYFSPSQFAIMVSGIQYSQILKIL